MCSEHHGSDGEVAQSTSEQSDAEFDAMIAALDEIRHRNPPTPLMPCIDDGDEAFWQHWEKKTVG